MPGLGSVRVEGARGASPLLAGSERLLEPDRASWGHAVRAASPPLVGLSASGPSRQGVYGLGSPRQLTCGEVPDAKRTPTRQALASDLQEWAGSEASNSTNTTLATSLEVLKQQESRPGSVEAPPSPVARKRGGNNYTAVVPVPGVMSNAAPGPPLRSGGFSVYGDGAMSPQLPQQELSPTRSRSVIQAVTSQSLGQGGSGPPSATSQMPIQEPARSLIPYASSPLLPPALMPSFPPPVQVSSVASNGDVPSMMPSPRRESRYFEDGVRSPPPAPPGQALPYPKGLDRTPHSARSGFVVNTLTRAQAVDSRPDRVLNVRREQASPCRVRYVENNTTATTVACGAAGSANGCGTNCGSGGVPAARGRPVLGPVPKGALPTRVAPSMTQVHLGVASKSPTACIRPAQW